MERMPNPATNQAHQNSGIDCSKADTKIQRILCHLLSGKSLTSWQCFEMFKHTRLAAAVHDLRGRGYPIKTIEEHSQDGTVYAKYVIEGVAS
jgi:hypothetical protein